MPNWLVLPKQINLLSQIDYFFVFIYLFFICYIVSKSWKDLQSPNIVIMQIGSGMMRVFQCEKFKGGDNR